MDLVTIDEIAGFVTVNYAMELLGKSHTQIANYIRQGKIGAVLWVDRLMLKKADVVSMQYIKIKAGRPKQNG